MCLTKNKGLVELSHKVSPNFLKICRRVVSKNVSPSATFRYISVCSATKFLCSKYKYPTSTSNSYVSSVTIDHYDTVGGRERETIGKIEISNKERKKI